MIRLTDEQDREISLYAIKHGVTWLEAYKHCTGLMRYDKQ